MSVIKRTRKLLESLVAQAGEGPGCPIYKICKNCGLHLPKKGNFEDCDKGTTAFQRDFKEIKEAIEALKTLERLIA